MLHRAVQEVLARGLNDPRVRGLISITAVRVSPDLSCATISVSIMPEEASTLAMHGLNSAVPYVRSELRKRIRMRRVPQLTFKLDQSLKKEAEIIARINAARAADEQRRLASAQSEEQEREEEQ